MNDIRIEEVPFEIDGKEYRLRCNMNVLADVQAVYGGDFGKALSDHTSMASSLEFLAAMLNDYADEQGWKERWTAKQIGRKLNFDLSISAVVMGLVLRSMAPPRKSDADSVSETDTDESKTDPGYSGN